MPIRAGPFSLSLLLVYSKRAKMCIRDREVTAVDPLTHSVTVHDLEKDTTYQESYDKLLLSPGASPVVPPIPGVDSPHVFALRHICLLYTSRCV